MISQKFHSATATAALLAVTGFAAIAAPADTIAPQEPAAIEAPAEAAPAAAEVAPALDAPAASVSVTAADLKIGTAVFGNDGQKIGELNRVTSESSGAVSEIQVTTGGKAGLNAEVVAITADKITAVGDGVKLSLSAEDAKALPVVSNGNG